RPAAHLDTENDADVIQTDRGQEALEAAAAFGRRAAVSLVLIDDLDLVGAPSQFGGTTDKCVLQVLGLPSVDHLVRRGLADVDDGRALLVPGPPLAGRPAVIGWRVACRTGFRGGRSRRIRSHRPPPFGRRDGAGGRSSDRGAVPGCRGWSAAAVARVD